MTSIGLKTKELLTEHCGCHGNLVTIAMRYVADVYYKQTSTMPNIKSIPLKTKELQRYAIDTPWIRQRYAMATPEIPQFQKRLHSSSKLEVV